MLDAVHNLEQVFFIKLLFLRDEICIFYLVFELCYLHYTSMRNLQQSIVLKLIYTFQLFLRPKNKVFKTCHLLFFQFLLNNLGQFYQEEEDEEWSKFTDDWHDGGAETTNFCHDVEDGEVAKDVPPLYEVHVELSRYRRPIIYIFQRHQIVLIHILRRTP